MQLIVSLLSDPAVIAIATLSGLTGINLATGGNLLWRIRKLLPGKPSLSTPEHAFPSRKVIGRDDAVKSLRAILMNGKTGAIVPALHGGAGYGKTTIARHYVQTYAQKYDHTEFIPAEQPDLLIDRLAQIGQRIGGPAEGPVADRATIALQRIADRTAQAPWCLVFDNVTDEATIAPWLPRGRNLHCIVTSRSNLWTGAAYEPLPAGVLSTENAVALLEQEADRPLEHAARLANELGHLPLALVQAGQKFRADPTMTVEAHLKELHRNLARHKPAPGAPEGTHGPVTAEIRLTLRSLSKDARAILTAFAYFEPDALAPRLISDLAEIPWRARWLGQRLRPIPRRIWAIARNPERLQQAILALRAAGILEPGQSDNLTLHRLTAAITRETYGGPKAHNIATAILAARYPYDADLTETWPECRRLTPHVLALTSLEPLPQTIPMHWLTIQTSLFLQDQAQLPPALTLARTGLRLATALHGPDHQSTGAAQAQLGFCLKDAGELDPAEAAFAEALRISRASGKKAELAICLNNHGLVLQKLGKLQNA